MHNLAKMNDEVKTMSSLEIAELTEKKHFHVVRDIRAMISSLYSDDPDMVDEQIQGVTERKDERGYTSEFLLDRDHTLTLVTGYSAILRMTVVKRWMELERKQATAMPDFSNPALAARAWADMYEAKLLADRTKAEIGSRREATAMNTASVAVKKATRLEIELDKSKDYSTIKRMEMLHHGQKFNWRLLKSTCAEMGLEAINIFDANYGTVKAYPAAVWLEAYALGIE